MSSPAPPNKSESPPNSSHSAPRMNGYTRERKNAYRTSRRTSDQNSPSNRLLKEFSRVQIAQDKHWNKKLDEAEAEQAKKHREALAIAAAEHDAIRQSAERAREKVEFGIVLARQRREEDERRAADKAKLDKLEHETAEYKRQAAEAEKSLALEREKAAALRKKQDAEHSTLQVENESLKRTAAHDQAASDRKAGEAAKQKQQQLNGTDVGSKPPGVSTPQQTTQTNPAVSPQANHAVTPQTPSVALPQTTQSAQPSNPLTTSQDVRDADHNQYLDLFKKLKVFRKEFLKECEAKGAKEQVGNWRREMNAAVGQLNKVDREANKATMAIIQRILDEAATISEPSVNISEYMIDKYGEIPKNGTATHGPATLLYLLNVLAKKLVAQFKHECAVDTHAAEPLGILACIMFARPNYRFNNQSLIDVLWAKYHRECPALFGITGKESSKSGRVRLGWRPRGTPTETAADIAALSPSDFPNDQEWYTSQTGLAVGFAAITLRDFSKSPNPNPAPNAMWWQAVARIINLPAELVQPTHYVLIKSLIEDHVDRIQKVFGQAGTAAIRKAVVDFPKVGPAKSPSVVAVESMGITLRQKYGVSL